jgi:hypothetical protein
VYTYYCMVAKKKPVKAEKKTEDASVSLEESVKQEERKPAVTQVVEVVEDEAPQKCHLKNHLQLKK